MKKHLLSFFLIISLSFLVMDAKSQWINNESFENWTVGISGFLDPDDWQTNNDAYASVIQTTGHTGTYACRLASFPGPSGIPDGGSINFSRLANLKPIGLSGFQRFNNASNDGLYITFNVYSNITLLGNSILNITQNTPNWTPFNMNVNYTIQTPPNGFEIIISYYPGGVTLNGYAEIDDLAMTYISGINDTITANFPSANLRAGQYVNSYNLFIDLLGASKLTTSLYNIQGKLLESKSENYLSGHHEMPIDISNYSKGLYIMKVALGNKQYSFKLNRL